MPSFTPTFFCFFLLWGLSIAGKGMEKVNSFPGSSPRAPPRKPSSQGRGAHGPTRAAHSPIQMSAHLSAAHFVNESSPLIDSSPLHLAIVERRCSLHRVLRNSHPLARWRRA